MTLAELKQDLENSRNKIDEQFLSLPEILSELSKLEAFVARRRSFAFQIIWLPVNAMTIYFWRKRIKRILKRDIKMNKADLSDRQLDACRDSLRTIYSYIETSKRLGQLMTYERLFSVWHILHLPLFIMLVITGFIHVIAVHMY